MTKENSTSSQVHHAEPSESKISWHTLSVILRIVLTLIFTQTGYIHPDEFFQGPQIVFDDFFRSNLTRTHEFNKRAPLRSVAILYLLYGLPVLTLSWLSSIFQWSSVPFHWRLVLPRTSILVLSFGIDILFYRSISLFYPNINHQQRRKIMDYYAISYITLVFFTRTLSNSFEAFLFLSLIYLIHVNSKAIELKLAQTSAVKLLTIALTVDPFLLITSLSIGFICALGIFNRPTFPVFAAVPVFYWLIQAGFLSHYSFRTYRFLSQILTLIVGAFLITCSLLILFDTFYYNDEFIIDVEFWHRLIICPLNFILYNTDLSNLDKHGLHPRWLHFLVNANLLFGFLHMYAVYLGLSYSSNRLTKLSKRTPSESSISSLAVCLYFVPFIPLSLIPHQEPRFLLPLFFPLLLLTVPQLITNAQYRCSFTLWLIFNLILTLIYGYLHQGGILPALDHIHRSSTKSEKISRNFLITYHTYMPPDYLVMPMSNYPLSDRIELAIIDLQGAHKHELDQTIQSLFDEHSIDKIQVFVLLPGTCRIHLTKRTFDLHLLKQFGPHFDFDHHIDLSQLKTSSTWISFIWNQYKLDFYEVERI